MKIAFCSPEVFPFSKTGGLGDVCGALPMALAKLNLEILIFLPYSQGIQEQKLKLTKINEWLLKTSLAKKVDVYFIKHDHFFNRPGLYGDKNGDYSDNLERFGYYGRSVLAALKELNSKVDIIHCHDWQSALIPVDLKEKYKKDSFYSSMRTLLTIHNLAYQGVFPKEEYAKLGLREDLFSLYGFEFFGKINLLKAGIIFSDAVNTVSPRYAKEIQTRHFGCGLDGVLRSRKDGIIGILNGLDYDFWNPHVDTLIEKQYSPETSSAGKLENKKALQRQSRFPISTTVPLFGFVGRLAHQKGIDLILDSAEELIELYDIQFIVQGEGNGQYSGRLKEMAQRFPKKFSVWLEFDEKMAHQIYAGSDFFLMPSLFEPCGLSQMISLKYGTIPIIFKTGGLVDTIIPFNKDKRAGNGLMFEHYNKKDFINIVKTAIEIFDDKEQLFNLISRAFRADFSWDQSASQYVELYQHCMKS